MTVIAAHPIAGVNDYKKLNRQPGQSLSPLLHVSGKTPSEYLIRHLLPTAINFAKQYENYVPVVLGRSPRFFLEMVTALRHYQEDRMGIYRYQAAAFETGLNRNIKKS